MQDTNDLYAELQVHPSAEPEVIEASYRRLSRMYHPDVNKSAAANDRMKRINHAYDVLGNAVKRAQYDSRLAYRRNSAQLNAPHSETGLARRSAPTDVVRANASGVKAPIHWAAEAGHAEAVQSLIAAGANVNAADEYGKTPLDLATENGHAAVVQTLRASGAGASEGQQRGYRQSAPQAYPKPAKRYTKEVVNPNSDRQQGGYLQNAPQPNIQPTTYSYDRGGLFTATREEDVEAVQMIISAGVDVNATTRETFYLMTPLHLAARVGHTAMVRALITAGANINATTGEPHDMTPLHLAALKGHVAVVQVLISAGANLNAEDRWGATPLHLAALKGHVAVVHALIDAGAYIHARENIFRRRTFETPLHKAASKGHVAVVHALIDAGAHVDMKARINESSVTPLYRAAEAGHTAVVHALIDAGANVNTCSFGKSPLYIAKEHGYTQVIRALKAAGAKSNRDKW